METDANIDVGAVCSSEEAASNMIVSRFINHAGYYRSGCVYKMAVDVDINEKIRTIYPSPV